MVCGKRLKRAVAFGEKDVCMFREENPSTEVLPGGRRRMRASCVRVLWKNLGHTSDVAIHRRISHV